MISEVFSNLDDSLIPRSSPDQSLCRGSRPRQHRGTLLCSSKLSGRATDPHLHLPTHPRYRNSACAAAPRWSSPRRTAWCTLHDATRTEALRRYERRGAFAQRGISESASQPARGRRRGTPPSTGAGHEAGTVPADASPRCFSGSRARRQRRGQKEERRESKHGDEKSTRSSPLCDCQPQNVAWDQASGLLPRPGLAAAHHPGPGPRMAPGSRWETSWDRGGSPLKSRNSETGQGATGTNWSRGSSS